MLFSGFSFLFEGTYLLQLGQGLVTTLTIALSGLLLSLWAGLGFGYLRLVKNPIIVLLSQLVLEAVRIVPLLVWLFIGYFGLPLISPVELSSTTVAISVFTLWGMVEIGELIKSTVLALPSHHGLAAKALGLSGFQAFLFILAPLSAVKISPGIVNLATRMIKTTSLLAIIGVTDVVRVSRQIIELRSHQEADTAFWVYGLLFVMFFIICYPLGKLAEYLEGRALEL